MDESAASDGTSGEAERTLATVPEMSHTAGHRVPSGEERTAARDLASSSPLGIAITRGESLVIRYMNPAFRRLLGVEGDLVLGRPFESSIKTPYASRIAVLLRRVLRTGTAFCDLEMRLDRKVASPGGGSGGRGASGSWRLTAWTIPEEGDLPKGLVLQVRDVAATLGGQRSQETLTEMREINQRLLVASLRELELMERAEAANEAKSAFLATMSHELRTPLTAILGYEELLRDGVSGPVTDRQQEHLSRIKLSAQHLLTLIDGILELARLDAKRETAQREPVAVDGLLDEAMTIVAPIADAKGLEFVVRRPTPSFVLYTDHSKLRQILINLASNAVKFTHRGEVALDAHLENEDAIFTVRDTGIGIPREHLEHIFDSFWQVEQTTTRTAGGSGLGLSISRRLAQLLGGELTVRSTEGAGSEFTLRLPLGAS
jgi:signal transduction histidine kinase